MTGLVLWGSNNIFAVIAATAVPGDSGGPRADVALAQPLLCRIKGKSLDVDRGHNVLAAGDYVIFEPDLEHLHQGLVQNGTITDRVPRTTELNRWNKKNQKLQTVAANVDQVVCVTSVAEPPFRPRFIDRLLVAAAVSRLPVLIVANKCDLPTESWIEQRLGIFESLGVEVIRTSARDAIGIDCLRMRCRGKRSVFVGQSGTGKSTLVNALVPGAAQATAMLSLKHDRGRHTTSLARIVTPVHDLPTAGGVGDFVVDTPGFREMELHGVTTEPLDRYFAEFVPYLGNCEHRDCLHRPQDADAAFCAVVQAVADGRIHPDRYESYLRIAGELLVVSDFGGRTTAAPVPG